MKLSDWARQQGVTYQTAWRWVKDGKMPVPVRQAPSGTWIVEEAPAAAGRVVVYCRISSSDQKSDLDRQTARVVEGANAQGFAVAEIVTEVGSGLNGKRRKLHRILADPAVAVIVVEHKDRLARFGVEQLQAALAATGRRLVIIDPEESTDDLVKDMADALTSMCARLYGRRAAKNRAARALAAATAAEPSV
ncbi:putative resolvase [Micromonospora rhizosphaerae]|uniref:Putative resolvase n=1 Tax=Micromonospora rhizosphaerae TaxID=568872 RepID=A0A1C6T0N1_9ACTN|nr:IS607 family transposase [Micromonospora rhizosphaerae]SCL35380.1 putative resolvase [Micromonospora rhizosphaerae]